MSQNLASKSTTGNSKTTLVVVLNIVFWLTVLLGLKKMYQRRK